MVYCPSNEARKDKFYERPHDLLFKMESCTGEDILLLSSGVSRTMKSNECYTMYTKENVAITLEGKHLQRKYFDMGIIGLLLIAMLQTMLGSVTNVRNTLEFLELLLLR